MFLLLAMITRSEINNHHQGLRVSLDHNIMKRYTKITRIYAGRNSFWDSHGRLIPVHGHKYGRLPIGATCHKARQYFRLYLVFERDGGCYSAAYSSFVMSQLFRMLSVCNTVNRARYREVSAAGENLISNVLSHVR